MNRTHQRFRLADLAERHDLKLIGDGDHEVDGVGTLEHADQNQISFLSNRIYKKELPSTRAGAVILTEQDAADCPVNCLVSRNPYADYAAIASLFEYRRVPGPGIHPSSVIDESALIGEACHIGPNTVISAGVRIGDGSVLGPNCYIAPDCVIGRDALFEANVTVMHNVRLGDRVIIHPGAVIGADGFGLAKNGGNWSKVPQLGSVVIGDDCEIGANSAIDRGAIEDTVLEDDVRIDNLVQIGHNCHIGAHTAIAGCVGIAGSTRVGRNCMIGGGTGILGHISIADNTTIGGMSALGQSIEEEGGIWASFISATPLQRWQRTLAHIKRLDQLVKRVRKLEKNLPKKDSND